jgi:hypothetical protein
MSNVPAHSSTLSIATFDSALAGGVCDMSRLKFIDAYGLVGTACALRATGNADLLLPDALVTRTHLSTMGFRRFLLGMGRAADLPEPPSGSYPDVVVPLRSTADSSGAQELSNLLWAQLAEHVDPLVLNATAEGVWEMVGNALEHSGEDALIMGQVYRAARGGTAPDHDDRVQVVIGE